MNETKGCQHPLASLRITVLLNGTAHAGLHLFCKACEQRVAQEVHHSQLKF